MAKVSVHIASWNHAHALPDALESLRAQTFLDFTLTLIDNASADGSVEAVRTGFPEATVLRNFKNLGTAHAHNQALELARNRWADDDKRGRSSVDRYVLIMAPDVILTPDFLEKMCAAVDGRYGIGSACGKLLRVRPGREEGDKPEFTDVIESTGIVIRRSRRVHERAAGARDGSELAGAEEVFGAPGALALYRAEALEQLRETDGEAFDGDFFTYKEDVDVAWRLRLLGWTSAHVPGALAYRSRGTSGSARRSPMLDRLAIRNHLLLTMKNDDPVNRLLHLPWIAVAAVGGVFSTLFLAPAALGGYLEAFALFPKMRRKRRLLMARRKASPRSIRAWFA